MYWILPLQYRVEFRVNSCKICSGKDGSGVSVLVSLISHLNQHYVTAPQLFVTAPPLVCPVA
jgi:hypothetical protein